MSRLLPALLVLAALCALGAPARAWAAWIPGEPLDGPSADVVGLAGLDLARDGTGGLAWLRRDGGEAHLFLSRHAGGAWLPGERVDAGVAETAREGAVAAQSGGRLLVAWVAGSRVLAALAPGGAPNPVGTPVELWRDPDGTPSGVATAMGVNGAGYVTWTTARGDVRAARVQDTWEAIAEPLDIQPGREAGTGPGRSRLGVSADGWAVVVWGEGGAVFARRLIGTRLSAFPQLLSLTDLGGVPAGSADSPDIAVEDDGSFAWAVFRQDVGGASRALARRLLGSQFEAPAPIDLGGGSTAPELALSSRGTGLAVTELPGAVAGSLLLHDRLEPPGRLDLAGASPGAEPLAAVDERKQATLAWRRDGFLVARTRLAGAGFEGELVLSRPELGPVVDHELTTDRVAGVAAALIQGAPGARTVAVAVHDRPPARAVGTTRTSWQKRSRPVLKWKPGLDQWGAQQYRVMLDGAEVGATGATALRAPRLTHGRHRWAVVSVDRRGQAVASRERLLRVDLVPPRVRLAVRGPRRRGAALRVVVRSRDRGAGLRRVSVDYGDGARTSRARSTHRWPRGRHTVKARVVDRAGNVARRSMRLRIR